jgi:Mg2+ and Co2+ transporter CorA
MTSEIERLKNELLNLVHNEIAKASNIREELAGFLGKLNEQQSQIAKSLNTILKSQTTLIEQNKHLTQIFEKILELIEQNLPSDCKKPMYAV